MPFAGAKAPEYPRPVSPISVDELPICADTIVYHNERDSIEDDSNERAAKRRRIEAYATSYLRGEPLFIATAQLKGPFGNGWKNPWARAKPKSNGIQQTAVRKAVHPTAANSPRQQQQRSSPSIKRPAVRESTHVQQEKSQKLLNRAENLDEQKFWARREARVHQSTVEEGVGEVRKVADWLKRNNFYEQAEQRHAPSFSSMSSPTYTYSQKRTKKWEAAPIPIEYPPVADPVMDMVNVQDVASRRSTAKMQHPEREEKRSLLDDRSIAEGKAQREMPKSSPVPMKGPWTSVLSQEGPELSKTSLPMEGDIGHNVVEVCEPAQAVVEPTSLPALDLDAAHATNEGQIGTSNLPHLTSTGQVSLAPFGSHMGSASLHTAPEHSSSRGHTSGLPALSKETSKASVLYDLPSAQAQAQPVLHSAPSNLSSNIQMIQDPPDPPASGAYDSEIITDHGAVPAVEEMNKLASGQHEDIPSADLRSYEQPGSLVPAVEDKADNFIPISAIQASTVKKTHTMNESKSSPKGSTKTRAVKKKKAAFLADENSSGSSQGSIKLAMKVAKPSALNQDKLNIVNAEKVSKCRPEAEESIGQSSPSCREKLISDGLVRKGILKSSLKTSTGPALSPADGASSSTKYDAQRPLKLNAIENAAVSFKEDDFDLDGAMNDLGSFLGTWDQQQEAVGLKISG
ncbi:hypothetical protein LTR47_008183 [Exophiala xenobiotica]|nr:hypothetical protein LTR47_008183 [Exophiala xenobiotica]KAK5244762.1 hypothetical protein LTS06_009727 [Exophiala xenobiotica]KAK5314340.1 hypothetical protein LTR93_010355 [Exophiala xenobiotica]KAK5354469.1 hypothetical protein LTR61_001769 [Exophiala xenobiotica]KAK5361498.1 hypothetical protein LTR11_009820 [Exophiala xenobiotica]